MLKYNDTTTNTYSKFERLQR